MAIVASVTSEWFTVLATEDFWLVEEAQNLERTLKTIEAVLGDAEKIQLEDSGVKTWLDRLKDAFYEADDLLDELKTEILRSKIEEEEEKEEEAAVAVAENTLVLKKKVLLMKLHHRPQLTRLIALIPFYLWLYYYFVVYFTRSHLFSFNRKFLQHHDINNAP